MSKTRKLKFQFGRIQEELPIFHKLFSTPFKAKSGMLVSEIMLVLEKVQKTYIQKIEDIQKKYFRVDEKGDLVKIHAKDEEHPLLPFDVEMDLPIKENFENEDAFKEAVEHYKVLTKDLSEKFQEELNNLKNETTDIEFVPVHILAFDNLPSNLPIDKYFTPNELVVLKDFIKED